MVATVKGGGKLAALAKRARTRGIKSYSVGFFPKAKYADGTQVALVGLWQEFGTRDDAGNVRVPERSFFRSTDKKIGKKIRKLVIKLRDKNTMVLDARGASKIAAFHAGQIQEAITDIKTPPNAPGTISAKGSGNPLIDTGFMRQSITWAIEDGS